MESYLLGTGVSACIQDQLASNLRESRNQAASRASFLGQIPGKFPDIQVRVETDGRLGSDKSDLLPKV